MRRPSPSDRVTSDQGLDCAPRTGRDALSFHRRAALALAVATESSGAFEGGVSKYHHAGRVYQLRGPHRADVPRHRLCCQDATGKEPGSAGYGERKFAIGREREAETQKQAEQKRKATEARQAKKKKKAGGGGEVVSPL